MHLFLHTEYLTKEIRFEIDDSSQMKELRQKVTDLVIIPVDNQLLYMYEKEQKIRYYIPEKVKCVSDFFVDGDHLYVKRIDDYFDPYLEAVG
jgi:hypothetical protein